MPSKDAPWWRVYKGHIGNEVSQTIEITRMVDQRGYDLSGATGECKI